MSTFKKTASSAGGSIATSTSTSAGRSVSGSYTGFGIGISGKTSSAESAAHQLAYNYQQDSNTSTEANKKTTTAFVDETIMMPMRSARLNYDGMRLSEDAKRAVRKLSTEREALHFLRTYGSHLTLGMITLGGSFSRTMFMESSKEVTTTTLYAAAGSQMSQETSTASVKETSAATSAGLFGLGFKAGGSSSGSEATKSGSSTLLGSSTGAGAANAKNDTFYSMDVSSLGPNASTPEQFYTLLNENTGTWAVIDRGDLDEVIPIWDLIKDELLDGAMKHRGSMDKGEKDDLEDEEFRIRRAIRLMKRAWGRKARKFMSNASPPNLPDVIVREIEDFVAEDKAVGEMVGAICSVIKPEKRFIPLDPNEEDTDGNRIAMLKSLKDVVSAARDEIEKIRGSGVYEYGNWWIDRFIRLGEKNIADQYNGLSKEKWPKFKFTVEINDEERASANQKEVSRIRKAHTRAAAASQELTDEAWEQLCDEFVPLAKCSKMKNFWSSDDYQRTTKIYNVHDRGTRVEALSLQTPISTITVDHKTSLTLHCPDAVTPIRVRFSPLNFFFDKKWLEDLKSRERPFSQIYQEMISANQTRASFRTILRISSPTGSPTGSPTDTPVVEPTESPTETPVVELID